jgi:hypothetical protein
VLESHAALPPPAKCDENSRVPEPDHAQSDAVGAGPTADFDGDPPVAIEF